MSTTYLALLHHPVYNKKREIITSAVTNLDIHDIARTARAYGLSGYFIVNPDKEQQALTEDICRHWIKGYGSRYNADRGEALKLIEIKNSLNEAVQAIMERHGAEPKLFATTASASNSPQDRFISYKEAGKMIGSDSGQPNLILFGTGWGLSEEVLQDADYILDPIKGSGEYNHLSVRAAAAIIIDRLFGD